MVLLNRVLLENYLCNQLFCGVMTTLSLTLPISCQICLGKVKDPVICSNNHAFCTVCLDVWLQTNRCCPTCRVDITEDQPYRKVIGSNESNETLNFQTRMQLRKTRLELVGKEYESEVENLSRQLNVMTQENNKLKEELKEKEQTTSSTAREKSPLFSNNIEALSSLTKKLQEISTTYDDVRRDMTKLQQEKEQLMRENDDLKNEVTKLKEDSMFTKSPKRYEKFTITGLRAKVEQYEKENQQLKKALENSDKYVEKLQQELRMLKEDSAKTATECMINAQHDTEVCDVRNDVEKQLSLPDQFEVTVENIAPLNHANSSKFQSNTVTAVVSVPTTSRLNDTTVTQRQQCHSPQNNSVTPTASKGECSRDLFPATKILLALKKIHETRSSPPQALHVSSVPAIDLPWSSYMNFDSSNEVGEENSLSLNATSSQESSEPFSFMEEGNETSASNNIILTAAGPCAVPSSEQTNPEHSCISPKRNLSVEPCLLTKKIKIEKD
ncbi:RING finger protein 219-like [Dendronephthya gigantea]|uniref:RING finger protein 219-like n=1 Tax=Dendronephthya gigantea TaxID=151771 RepID=UPI001069FDC9|nr:RING finger protein 219-like [Dendronephthya gigantea]